MAAADLFARLLAAPDAPPPWAEIEPLPWWRAMATCPQDPIHHAEGDVATHTRLVVEALRDAADWRTLPDPADRGALLLAALLHDIGKPDTTRIEDNGRITARGHSARGEPMARRMLWEADIPFTVRERVCALIRFHQVPFWLIEREPADARFRALSVSHSAAGRCDHLAILADADARGRVCADQAGLLVNVALFAEFCAELGCWDRPYPFADDLSRWEYFRSRGARDPAYRAYDARGGDGPTFVLLAGLPGAGKDTFLRRHLPGLPVVSLDELRARLGVSPRDGQEPVVDAARTAARDLLRRGESLVWNATNLSRELRGKRIAFAADYGARVRIVYLEAPAALLRRRNRGRGDAAVPDAAVERMLRQWGVPDATEAHAVEWHPNGVPSDAQ